MPIIMNNSGSRDYLSAGIFQQFYCESVYRVTDNQLFQWNDSMLETEAVKHRALDDARQIIRLLCQKK